MKIRAGFVSNSSSTSFLIITHRDLNRADFFELMGIDPKSPIADLFEQFYQDVVSSVQETINFASVGKALPLEAVLDNPDHLSAHMLKKLKSAQKQGLKAYLGSLDSETSMIQTFFCTDSFEAENEKMYFDCLECVW